jgi:hypothetical protein
MGAMDMEELSVDLILLTARSSGTLPYSDNLRFGLSGSELVRLVAARRVDIAEGRIVVLDMTPTGDELLDQALASMADGRRAPSAKAWVARRRAGHVQRYRAQLAADGILRVDRHNFLGLIPADRWKVADTARPAQARSRLEAVAASIGPVQPAQAALAGLATAIGVARLVFPGRSGSAARERLKQAASGDFAAAGASQAAGASARDKAHQEAVNDALSSAIDSVIQAAVHAATEATHHAAHSSGHSGHSGGGGGHH